MDEGTLVDFLKGLKVENCNSGSSVRSAWAPKYSAEVPISYESSVFQRQESAWAPCFNSWALSLTENPINWIFRLLFRSYLVFSTWNSRRAIFRAWIQVFLDFFSSFDHEHVSHDWLNPFYALGCESFDAMIWINLQFIWFLFFSLEFLFWISILLEYTLALCFSTWERKLNVD